MRVAHTIFHFLFVAGVLAAGALAHPGSGIAVDRRGQIYFVDTGQGVWKIDFQGRLAPHEGPAFHWLAIDVENRFANTRFPSFPNADVRRAGSDPTLILSSDFPLVIGADGALYYAQLGRDERLEIIRLTPAGDRSVRATLPKTTDGGELRWLNGIAAGSDGSIYCTDDRAVRKITTEGVVSTVASKVTVADCVRVPSIESKWGAFLRGLSVAADGSVFVAASGCGAVIKVAVDGKITPVLRTESPWSPTDVAVAGNDVYVLEYLHTASDNRREWLPRVRKLSAEKITLVAEVKR